MWSRKFSKFLRHAYRSKQWYSTNSMLADSQKFKLPDNVLPKVDLLQTLNVWEQGKVARIIVELEALYAVVDEVPKEITSSHWEYMLSNTYQIYDRQEYLRQLYFNEKNEERTREENELRKSNLKDQMERFARGEIIYERGFNELYSICGKDFRRLIDCYYSRKLLLREQLDGGFPQIFVDCQFLHRLNQTWLQKTLNDFQKLHLKNWTSSNPLQITFSNYLADSRVTQAARNSLKFVYGPQAKNSLEAADESNEHMDTIFESQEDEEQSIFSSFYPRITNRDFCSILPDNVQRDEIAYVTQIGNRVLDEDVLNKSKVFIVQAFPEHLLQTPFRTSLMKSLMRENIRFYRLPFDAHLKCLGGHKAVAASSTTSILREMLSKKVGWKSAMMNNVPKSQFALPDDPNSRITVDDIELFLNDTWVAGSKHKTLSETRVQPRVWGPRNREHRYSREERNQMRQNAS